MLNDPPEKNDGNNDRNSSEPASRVNLRIPSATPLFTGITQMILILLFILRSIAGSPDPAVEAMAVQGTAVLDGAQVYRLITAQLLLVLPAGGLWMLGLVQALFSLYTLYIVGNEMEKLWGNLRFGLVFVLGGASGGLLTLILTPTGLIPMDVFYVTAPTAIMATLGAQLVYMIKHRKLYGSRGIQRRNFLIGVAVINLLIAALVPQVDVFGMIGGIASGIILSIYISPYHLPRPHPEEPNALLGEDVNPLKTRIVALVAYTSVLLSAILLGVVYIG